jgi:hypothetical protein
MGLKVVALTSLAMTSLPYKFSFKSVNWYKSYWGRDPQTDTHADGRTDW